MSDTFGQTVFEAPGHDHDACIRGALARADALCAERGLRLTAIRRRVLELIWDNHRPTKAYDLLSAISAERGNAAPPTVYRALDFLLEAGLVHKIESLNAFVGCDAGHERGHPKFLICRRCEHVAEIPGPAVDSAIAREAERSGFTVDHETIEIGGICRRCAAAD
ncbi:Fur family transcriptional regulator [Salinisphaera orenii MK-B5]|uniref:Ferric uptake regulation protein n=2 Tax=Salinisphaera orenii TaxID=856731 RepID=A0A423PFL7_9GAMM|nr:MULTISPECIES: Fur family transcriptional regulator [Salinisphaera]ROO24439.1 Fur family transcriptional regulator [Salinisphaera orenii MK-B5]ROO28190.1 Fur family transcriptional regulator [Salinisphaera halophila YIM 95161]